MPLLCKFKAFILVLYFFMQYYGENKSADISESCASLDVPGSIVTKRDTVLKGHVRLSIPNVSWVQCGLRCQRQQWCISINFQLTSNTGRCELNDYGVQDEMSVSDDGQFERKPGYIYTQIRPAKVGHCWRLEPATETCLGSEVDRKPLT